MKPTLSLDDRDVAETYISTDLESQSQLDFVEEYEVAEQENIHFSHIRKLLYHLARNHLENNDWKRLARFWDFTEEQIKGMLASPL